jgi:hypothetical protein
MSDELENTWKEAIVAYFKVVPQHLSQNLRKTMKMFSLHSGLQDETERYAVPFEYKAGLLTTDR